MVCLWKVNILLNYIKTIFLCYILFKRNFVKQFTNIKNEYYKSEIKKVEDGEIPI